MLVGKDAHAGDGEALDAMSSDDEGGDLKALLEEESSDLC